MRKGKNAQLTAEFVIFCGVGFIVLISFLSVINLKLSIQRDERASVLVNDVAYSIQQEIETASQMNDGFQRSFFLPPTLDGIAYTASIAGDRIYVWTDKDSFSLPLQHVKNTSFFQANTTIRKEQGVVCINVGCP